MTATDPTTADLVAKLRNAATGLAAPWNYLREAADRLAALAPLEPLGRLVAAMEANRGEGWPRLELARRLSAPGWLATIEWYGVRHYAEADTPGEALAALADALGEDGGREGA